MDVCLSIKCDLIFVSADQDGDGRLGYTDLAWLVKATNTPDTVLSRAAFDKICEDVGAFDKLITKEHLHSAYEAGMGSIEEDWDKLKASRMAKVL